MVEQVSTVKLRISAVLLTLIPGHEVAAAVPGIILRFKAERRGKRSGIVWFCFCNWRASDPPEVPIRYYLYLIGQYQVT